MRRREEVAAGPERGTAAGEDRAEDRAGPVPGRVVEPAATHQTGAGAPRASGAQALDQGNRGGDGFHPIAEVWPLLPEPELQELADDIKANGLHNPIWRHRDGRIIDGRNRWLACRRAGIDCPSRSYEGQDGAELIAFVVSLNDKRRHLTVDQRAAIAAEIANLGHGQKKADTAAAVSQPEAARLMGVSVDSVQRARAVKRADPELHAKVKRGEIKAGRARAEVARKQGKVAAPAKKAKTRVSPAAPPAKDPVAPALLGSARPTGARNKSGLDLLGEITSLQKGRDGGAIERSRELASLDRFSARALELLDSIIAAEKQFLQGLENLRERMSLEMAEARP